VKHCILKTSYHHTTRSGC